MGDPKKDEALPGNHGQFGVNDASEAHKTLDDAPIPAPEPDDAGDAAKMGP